MRSPDYPTEPAETPDLGRLLKVLRERKWVIIAMVAIVVGAAAASYLRATPQYRATAQIVRQQTNLDRALFGTQIFELADMPRELATGASMVKKRAVAEKVQEQLQSPRSPSGLLGMISVSPEGETNLVDITAVSANAQEAADVANAFAEQFILYRREVDQGIVETARTAIQDQLDQMSAGEKNSERGLMLSEKAEDLRILKEMQTGGFEIAQTADTPTFPFSPQLYRTILLALAVGLALGVGLAFLMDALDRRIKDEKSLEREFGLPVLASVPDVGRRRIGRAKRSLIFGLDGGRSPLIEPFRTLRSNLQYFEVNGRLGSILITSALPEEGKTLTTINLALSLAISGARVVIVEADLRRPTLHAHLGLSNDVGVSSVLAGARTIAEAVQLVQIEGFAALGTRRDTGATDDSPTLSRKVYCVTAGPLPPNPAELAGSAHMRGLLDEAAQHADYVLVDSAPLLPVADSLALAGQVDAVLLTARVNRTTVDEARKVQALLARIGAHPIGVVAIGVGRAHGYNRYGYYAAPGKVKA